MTKVIFFGNEQLAQGLRETITPSFDALISNGYEVIALVLPRNPQSHGRRKVLPEIVKKASTKNIPIIFANEEENLNQKLASFSAEIGVLSAFGKIVSEETIKLFPHGIVNIHPSLLPKYRGSTPIESAILNGDKETGVSLMALSKKMDAGVIYDQTKITLNGDESKQNLYEKLANLGAELLIKNLPKIIAGENLGVTQNETEATFTKQIQTQDSELNPETMTASDCERQIRAYFGWPKSRLDFHGQKLIVTAAEILAENDGAANTIPCAEQTYLKITEVVSPKSGKKMPFSDYLNGLK